VKKEDTFMGLFKNVRDKLISVHEGKEVESAEDDYIDKLTAGLKDEQEEVKEPEINYENEPEKIEQVHINSFTYNDMMQFIRGQCEIMEDALHHIDRLMDSYNELSEEFSDIELYENAPDNLKESVSYYAEYVDSLTVDRRILASAEKQLSNKAYQRMDKYREEIPGSIQIMEQQEAYFTSVKRDLNLLQGEKMALRLEGKELKRKQNYIRKYAFYLVISFAIVYGIFAVAVVAIEDHFNMLLFFLVSLLGACVAIGIFAYLKMIQRRVLQTEIKLNKATSMLNKIKVKYVNSVNLLEYEYKRYRVNNVRELQKKYDLYLQMKEEQKRVFKMTTHLSEAEAGLMKALERVGMVHTNVWLGQVKALYNKKEMVEVRHKLAQQRQSLRNDIAQSEQKIVSVKSNIKAISEKYPEYMEDILNMLQEFEERNA